jgi:hypothetical protein
MVSSFALHYGNDKTCTEMLRIHPDEGPRRDPALRARTRTSCAARPATVAGHRRRPRRPHMGCPVPKVRKTGAAAAMLR